MPGKREKKSKGKSKVVRKSLEDQNKDSTESIEAGPSQDFELKENVSVSSGEVDGSSLLGSREASNSSIASEKQMKGEEELERETSFGKDEVGELEKEKPSESDVVTTKQETDEQPSSTKGSTVRITQASILKFSGNETLSRPFFKEPWMMQVRSLRYKLHIMLLAYFSFSECSYPLFLKGR